jgi:hypothetical protein
MRFAIWTSHSAERLALSSLCWETGGLRGQRQIAASEEGSLDALRFAAGLGEQERVWAIEDCRVPAAMTGQARKVSRQAGKSDPIDARAVALAVVRDGVHSFSGRVHRRPGAGDPGAVRLPRSDHL